jgi:MFS family permease
MLFAVDDSAYTFGLLVGAIFSGVICGLWPLSAGAKKGLPVIGIIGFAACVVSGFVLGCILALPTALFFRLLISVFPSPEPPPSEHLDDRPFNPYAGGKGSAF